MVTGATQGTAATEAVTADAPLSPPPGPDVSQGNVTPPESGEREPSPETEPKAAPETDERAEETKPEPPDWREALSAADDDELAEHEKVKNLLARREESSRRRAEADTARRIQAERQQWLQQGQWAEEIESAFSLDEESGRVSADRKKVQGVVERLNEAASLAAWGGVTGLLNAVLPADASIPKADLDRIEDVRTDVLAGRAQPADYVKAQLEAVLSARERALEPDLRKRIEAELRKEAQAKAEVEKREAKSEERKAEPAPTRGAQGPGGRIFTSQVQIDTAHVKGELTDDEVRALRMDGTYAGLPWQ